MNRRLPDTILRALRETRSGKPMVATDVLRQALTSSAAVVPSALDPAADPPRARSAFRGTAKEPSRNERPPGSRRAFAKPRLRGSLDGTDLAAFGHGLPGMRERTTMPPIPAGARYEWRVGGAMGSTRRYRLYVPASAPTRPRGLVLMLHGCTQNPDDFALGTRFHREAERHQLVVAWPEQTARHNANSCWNWFRPEDQQRATGEPAILAAIATDVQSEFDIAPRSCFIAGLSAGGAMAHIVAITYPDVFSAAGVHSGLARGAASDVASAFAAMRGQAGSSGASTLDPSATRLIVFHGTADPTVHPSNAEQVFGSLSGLGEVEQRHLGGLPCRQRRVRSPDGRLVGERWEIAGLGHAWSGGDPAGSYAVSDGPDATAEMVRFFLDNGRGDL